MVTVVACLEASPQNPEAPTSSLKRAQPNLASSLRLSLIWPLETPHACCSSFLSTEANEADLNVFSS